MTYERPRVQGQQTVTGQLARASELSLTAGNPTWRRAATDRYECPAVADRQDLRARLMSQQISDVAANPSWRRPAAGSYERPAIERRQDLRAQMMPKLSQPV